MNPINCLSCYPLIDCPEVRHWLPVTLQLTFKRTMSREKTDADVTSTITGKWRLKVKRCIKTWIRKWVDKPFCCERLLFFLLPFVSRDKVPKKKEVWKSVWRSDRILSDWLIYCLGSDCICVNKSEVLLISGIFSVAVGTKFSLCLCTD